MKIKKYRYYHDTDTLFVHFKWDIGIARFDLQNEVRVWVDKKGNITEAVLFGFMKRFPDKEYREYLTKLFSEKNVIKLIEIYNKIIEFYTKIIEKVKTNEEG